MTRLIFPEDLPARGRASLLAYRGGALGALGQTAAAQQEFEDGCGDPHSVEVRVIAGRLAIDRGDSTERVSDSPRPCARPRTTEE